MPYIRPNQRNDLLLRTPQNAGELNYTLTQVLLTYLRRQDGIWTYQDINDALGALEGAKLEFYRRVVVPYEENKREENGDVYVR